MMFATTTILVSLLLFMLPLIVFRDANIYIGDDIELAVNSRNLNMVLQTIRTILDYTITIRFGYIIISVLVTYLCVRAYYYMSDARFTGNEDSNRNNSEDNSTSDESFSFFNPLRINDDCSPSENSFAEFANRRPPTPDAEFDPMINCPYRNDDPPNNLNIQILRPDRHMPIMVPLNLSDDSDEENNAVHRNLE